ncbi:hypothetical protein COOONC_25598 [Cooperia oncophora]
MPSRPSYGLRMRKQVVIFTQPNSSDLGSFLQPRYVNLPQFAEIFEMDVYGFDYSGYGYSTGTVSEKNIYADIRAVYDHIRRTRPNKQVSTVLVLAALNRSSSFFLMSSCQGEAQ